VLDLFLDAVAEYGVPSRVRGDRGGENIEVSVWVIMHRGANRASFMWGSWVPIIGLYVQSVLISLVFRSTRNTRIEHLWVEVGTQFARQWRTFFTRLERMHGLEHSKSEHLWLLHNLFLDEINSDCKEFQLNWNHHPISGSKGKNRSPMVCT